MDKKLNLGTLCVQAGWTPKKGEPRVVPIYQSTTFKYDTSEQMARLFDLEDSGYFYTRLQNPTNDAVAAKIAALGKDVTAAGLNTEFSTNKVNATASGSNPIKVVIGENTYTINETEKFLPFSYNFHFLKTI